MTTPQKADDFLPINYAPELPENVPEAIRDLICSSADTLRGLLNYVDTGDINGARFAMNGLLRIASIKIKTPYGKFASSVIRAEHPIDEEGRKEIIDELAQWRSAFESGVEPPSKLVDTSAKDSE